MSYWPRRYGHKVAARFNGRAVSAFLVKLSYTATRQTGSHVRLTCELPAAQHHVTIPLHDPLRIGTLAAILEAVGQAKGLTREELLLLL
jgi:predicted RNA binding protein YcfA (HicA-like mRNA interferase family)